MLDAAALARLLEADLDRMTVTEGVLGIRISPLGVEGCKSAPIDIASLEASALTVDMAARKVIVGRLVSRKARIEAVRLRDGSIDLAALFDGADKDAAPAASDAQAPWLVENGRLELADWTIRMEDRTSAPHSQMLASKVALSVDGLSSRADAPLKVSLDGRINRRGQLRVSGTLVPAPFAADLKLDLGGVDLLPLQQYLTEKTNVLITHGARGRGRLCWPAVDVGAARRLHRPRRDYRFLFGGPAQFDRFRSLGRIRLRGRGSQAAAVCRIRGRGQAEEFPIRG